MTRTISITSAESAVMEVLWREGPADADAITAALTAGQGWSATTVRTLLERLARKAAVAKVKTGGQKLMFSALIARADYVHAESKGLIDRLFEGRLGPMFAQFSERETLSAEDIADLKALIARIEDGR